MKQYTIFEDTVKRLIKEKGTEKFKLCINIRRIYELLKTKLQRTLPAYEEYIILMTAPGYLLSKESGCDFFFTDNGVTFIVYNSEELNNVFHLALNPATGVYDSVRSVIRTLGLKDEANPQKLYELQLDPGFAASLNAIGISFKKGNF